MAENSETQNAALVHGNSDTILKSINSQALVLYLVALMCVCVFEWSEAPRIIPFFAAGFSFVLHIMGSILDSPNYVGYGPITAEVIAGFTASFVLWLRSKRISNLRLVLEIVICILNGLALHVAAMYALFWYAEFEAWQMGYAVFY